MLAPYEGRVRIGCSTFHSSGEALRHRYRSKSTQAVKRRCRTCGAEKRHDMQHCSTHNASFCVDHWLRHLLAAHDAWERDMYMNTLLVETGKL